MEKAVAIITSYNRADFIIRCLQSVLDSSSENLEVNILVMDNGSSDGSPELAANLGEKVRIEHTHDNLPLIGVINRGLRICLLEMNPTFIILMNEDTEFQPGALELLVEVAKDHPNALITPLQINYYDPERVDKIALAYAHSADGLLEDCLLGRPLKSAYPVRQIIGAGLLAKRDVWERLGFLDELYVFYGSDDDLCNRALYLGYEVLLAPHSRMLHAHGIINPSIRSPDTRKESRKYFNMAQRFYMEILKNPFQTFPRCLARFFRRFVSIQLKLFFSLRPSEMFRETLAFWYCVIKIPRVVTARREQFSELRRALKTGKA